MPFCNIIEPIFERSFISDSYACRKGKGTHAAVNRLKTLIQHYPYSIKIDIRKYFQSIRQDLLFSILSRKIGDQSILWLIRHILRSYREPHPIDDRGNYLLNFDGPLGIPIGNLTSQFFANVYLNPFDHFVKETLGVKAYLRYVDDMLVLHHSKQRLYEIKNEISDYLLNQNHLSIHENCAHVVPVRDGIDFLGYRVFPSHVLVRNGNGHRFLKRFKKLRVQYREKQIALFDVTQSVVSWIGHVSHADSWGLRTSLFENAKIVKKGDISGKSSSCDSGRFLEQQSRKLPIGEPEQQDPR